MDNQYRNELKYIISKRTFYNLKKKLSLYLKPDKNMIDGMYTVRSLYFDTPYDEDLFATLSGLMEKSKIRLRMYPPRMDKMHLELKQKFGVNGIKTTVRIDEEEAKELMKSKYSFLLTHRAQSAKRIYMHLASSCYVPSVIVEYKRCAYRHPVSNTRVTFDYDIRGCIAYRKFFDDEIYGQRMMESDLGVLEVKYDNFLMNCVKEILEGMDELNVANSKYANARLLF